MGSHHAEKSQSSIARPNRSAGLILLVILSILMNWKYRWDRYDYDAKD